jgi:hypothetical protein
MRDTDILAAFRARKYTPTGIHCHASVAFVDVASGTGVTQGTLHKRFRDCEWLQVVGFGYDPSAKVYSVMVRVGKQSDG